MEPRGRARIRTNDPQAMRGRILDAAADLFQAKGYHDTSVQDVKTAAGVTSGAFQHHFASKKALGLAVVEERIGQSLRQVWLAPVMAAPGVALGVQAAVGAISDTLRARRFVRGCAVNNLAVELAFSDSEFRQALNALFEDWRAVIADKIRAEGVPPALAPATAEEAALLVVSVYSGAMTMAKAEQSTKPLETAVGMVARLFAR